MGDGSNTAGQGSPGPSHEEDIEVREKLSRKVAKQVCLRLAARHALAECVGVDPLPRPHKRHRGRNKEED